MKILIASPRYYPETFSITNIAEELVKRGHDVTVVTGMPHYARFRLYPGYSKPINEVLGGVKIIRLNEKVRTPNFKGLVFNYLSIGHIYKKFFNKLNEKFDMVFSYVVSPIFAYKAIKNYCKKFNVPHFAYGLDIWPESLVATGYSNHSSLLYKLMKKESIKIYNSFDLISYASPSVETYLKDYLKVNPPFRHIYQPCLNFLPDDNVVNNHLYKKDDKVHILFCGSIVRFNHLEIMINALAKSKNKNNMIFNVVGSGIKSEELENLTKELNLNNSVKFHGRVSAEETIKHYVENDILFVPLFHNCATGDMIPQKIIEYFMYNRPILGMLKGDGLNLMQKASKLNIYSDQTIDDMVKAIDSLYEMSVEEMEQCGDENRKFYLSNKRFSLSTVVDELEDAMQETIKIHKEKRN